MQESNVVALRDSPVDVLPPPIATSSALMPADMNQAIRLAEMMSKGKLVPQHLQESAADCLMVIEQASRWRMSPFAVAQATSSVKGKLMFEGKLVAAAIHTSGILVGRLAYKFSGAGPKRAVEVSGLIRGESEPKTVEVVLENVVTDNGIWKKQPDQQLCYSGARVWARRHAPEVMLGVYSPEEDFDDAPPAMAIGDSKRAPDAKASYTPEKFNENFPAWEQLIKSGKKTAEAVIATVEAKASLSEDQKQIIRDIKVEQKQEHQS